MENFEDDIEQTYHERFHDFEEMPDDAAWSKIQARIAPETDKRPVVFWWNNYRNIGIAASILLGLLWGGYYFLNKNTAQMSSVLSNKIPENTPKTTQNLPKSQVLEKEIEATNQAQNATKVGIKVDKLAKNKTIIENIQPKKESDKSTEINPKEESLPKIASNVLPQKIVNEPQKTENQTKIVDNFQPKIAQTEPILTQKNTPNPAEELAKKPKIITEIAKTKPQIEKEIVAVEVLNKEKIETISRPELALTDRLKSDINFPNINEKSIQTIDNQVFKEKIFTKSIATVSPKNGDFAVNIKPIEIVYIEPVVEQDFSERQPKQRLVFIPPTEIYANVSPMLSYYVFSPNRADDLVVKDFNSSASRLSFAAQVGVVYPLGKKTDFRTGLSFMAGKSNISYGFTDINQNTVKLIDERTVEFQPINNATVEQRNWQYLELQTDLLYHVRRLHALSLGLRAGVAMSALNKPVFNGRIGYRVSRPINNRVALWVEPSVVVALLSQQSFENRFLYRTNGFSMTLGVSLLRRD